MACPPIFTQTQIDELAAAIASGVLRVRFSGPPAREVEYQDVGEMRQLLAQMRREVCGTTSRRLATHDRGFR